jgi:hypothetical protein
MLRGENLNARRTDHPSSTSSTTNPTWTGVDSKLHLRGDWPATNGISSGTVAHCVRILEVSSGIRGRHRSASRRAERNCFCDSIKNLIAFCSSEALECGTQIVIPTVEEFCAH